MSDWTDIQADLEQLSAATLDDVQFDTPDAATRPSCVSDPAGTPLPVGSHSQNSSVPATPTVTGTHHNQTEHTK